MHDHASATAYRSASAESFSDRSIAEIERAGTTLLARVRCPLLGQHEAPELARIVGGAIERSPSPPATLVLDLSAVSAISSMGLGTCLDLRRRGDAVGAETILLGLSSHLRNVLCTMRLDRLFTILDRDSPAGRRILGGS